jgi:hypothetical protein
MNGKGIGIPRCPMPLLFIEFVAIDKGGFLL